MVGGRTWDAEQAPLCPSFFHSLETSLTRRVMAAVQFLAGCTFAGGTSHPVPPSDHLLTAPSGVTYLFHTRIQQQTAQLSADLHALSLKLRTLSPDAAPQEQGVIPTRLPFKESLKARVRPYVPQSAYSY